MPLTTCHTDGHKLAYRRTKLTLKSTMYILKTLEIYTLHFGKNYNIYQNLFSNLPLKAGDENEQLFGFQ